MKGAFQMLRSTGWAMAFVGFASAMVLDPWALEHDAPVAFPFRQAQIAVLTMAFFLLSLARAQSQLKTAAPAVAPALSSLSRLTVVGAILYAGGWAISPWFRPTQLVVLGALTGGVGCAFFAALLPSLGDRKGSVTKGALWTMAGGCVLLAVTALWTLFPHLRPAYIGPDDGLRLRLLRLAQVAAFALPSLVLLLPPKGAGGEKWRGIMAAGAAGMPFILSVAAFTSTAFKYFLPLPALAVFGASAWGAWQTNQTARSRLAFAGWSVIAASMGVGLFMGLYAFNGPAPPPPHFADYNDFVRRLSRLGHAYLILIGLLALFMSGEREKSESAENGALLWLLGSGMLTTLGASILAAARLLPPGVLCIGPVLVTVALCLHFARPGNERKTL